jgi:hypothetical protein
MLSRYGVVNGCVLGADNGAVGFARWRRDSPFKRAIKAAPTYKNAK